MKRWLYVAQQRLAITNAEATALLTVSFLLVVGLITGEVRSRLAYFDEGTYAASDRLFRQQALAVVTTPPTQERTQARPDSTATTPAPTPAFEEARPPARKTPGVEGPGALEIDLNTATADELQRLPRIGPKIAERIVEFRNVHGPFRQTSDLMSVRGIGSATFAQLEKYVRISRREGEEVGGSTTSGASSEGDPTGAE